MDQEGMGGMGGGMAAGAAGAEKTQEQPGGGYCIEICVMPDGKITVESGPLGDGEHNGTPVQNIDEALAKAKELYAQGGNVGGDEAFDAGYGKPAPSPMMVRVREGE